jgi:hypothetical protein
MQSTVTNRTLPAAVVLNDGRFFYGEAHYDGTMVTLTGRSQTMVHRGGKPTVVNGDEVVRSWPISAVKEIRWERGS